MVLCALVDEPGLWRAGVDLFGDSEIAESYRHGDRLGRLDLHKMMGSPDDPARVEVYRRGSPVYRAERIQAPLLILHGRKDKRVVPLMSERMIEALEIEGKRFEVALVRRGGPRLGAAREPARFVRADPGLPEDLRPRRTRQWQLIRARPLARRRIRRSSAPGRSPTGTCPRLVVSGDVAGEGGLDRIADVVNQLVGSMWLFVGITMGIVVWLFAGNIVGFDRTPWPLLLTILNLPQLSIMISLQVSANRAQAASDARARADHATLVALHELAKQQVEILDAQNRVLEILRRAVAPGEPDRRR